MVDRISLKNMQFYGYHGAYAAEKELGQPVEVDVDLFGDFSRSSLTDDVELSINYVDVYTIVKDLVEEQEFNLIEALAEAIASQIVSSYDLKQVRVRVRRPLAPVGGLVQSVEVEIVRPGSDKG